MISHAVLEKYNSLAPYQNHDYHMFDFSQESISSIKEFLIRYCDDRKREGYFMLQDPLSSFYDALCVGIDDSSGKNHSREEIPDQYEYMENGIRPSKSFIASQCRGRGRGR
ncbi:uncharacterized protein LOC127255673 isoform X2 [Andrographis paniculata]|uniref:uncharacterized protein LOC127255673 isoform X2 n=1 Tax=Andrographis paniculata TaxID=175694 RepID=UPI0021E8A6C5|nr:uncharacterized protein LOC127255673 isoform X2 [Andrographis paniculata]